jgi:hypothetical protein
MRIKILFFFLTKKPYDNKVYQIILTNNSILLKYECNIFYNEIENMSKVNTTIRLDSELKNEATLIATEL